MQIFINERPFDVLEYYRRHGFDELPRTPTMSAIDILRESGGGSNYRVYLDRGYERPWVYAKQLEVAIPAEGKYPSCTAIALEDGMRFIVIPPCGF